MYNEEGPEDDYTSIKHIQVKDTLNVNHNHHIDEDSIRRHEMDRGSDIEYERRTSFKRQHATEDGVNNAREQLFIRDGNTEILRLVTRGNLDNSNENLYINVPIQHQQNCPAKSPHYVLVEGSGKEILMRRFIEEQANGKQIIREHYRIVPDTTCTQTLPNEVQESDTEKKEMEKQKKINLVETELAQATSHQSLVIQHELEHSLKQQNALLRQILLEKERLEEKYREHENALETQSLPCHSVQAAAQTQTDCEIAVQTEPWNLEMNGSRASLFRRRTRSENDDSATEDEYEYVRYSPPNSPNGIYWIKRRRHRKKSKGPKDQMPGPRKVVTVESVKRKIRTPIQEESEDKGKRKDKSSHKDTRASNLRRAKIANDRHRMVQEKLYYDLNDSLDEGEIVPNIKTKTQKTIKYFIEDSDGSENEVIMHKNYYSADSLDVDYEMDDHMNDDERRRMTESVPPTPAIRRGIMKDKNRKQQQQQQQYKSFEVEYESSPEKLSKSSRAAMADRQKTYNKLTYEMPNTKAVPRYMEWYSKGKEGDSPRSQPPPKAKRKSKELQEPKPEPMPRNTPSKEAARLLKEDLEMAKKIESRTHLPDPLSHPLLQHSEHRFEHEYSPQPHIPKQPTKLPHYMYPNTPPTHGGEQKINIKYKPNGAPINENEISKTTTTIKIPIEHNGFSNPNITTTSTTVTKMMNANNLQQQQQNQQHYEDDHDSGIAMNSLLHGKRNKIAEKKSVFTIAYDDVQIKRIQMNENEDYSPVN